MRRGLIVGKFHPPHRGHSFLIDVASSQVDQLVVLVCERSDQPLTGDRRARWLREAHPSVDVRVVEDILADDDSRAWAQCCREILGYTPDVVFTSESYGDEFAACLGCRHVCVDLERATFPCSGSAISADPLGNLTYLYPSVRAYYIPRVVVVGAESTGKTTLCERLAERFRTSWVREYGREYWKQKAGGSQPSHWHHSEFAHIAREQQRREDEAARWVDRILICDTDAFATKIWHERYLGSMPVGWPERCPPAALYLLTNVDAPFIQDGTRDGEHVRRWMHERFLAELNLSGSRFFVLSGNYEDRFAAAVAEMMALESHELVGGGDNTVPQSMQTLTP